MPVTPAAYRVTGLLRRLIIMKRKFIFGLQIPECLRFVCWQWEVFSQRNGDRSTLLPPHLMAAKQELCSSRRLKSAGSVAAGARVLGWTNVGRRQDPRLAMPLILEVARLLGADRVAPETSTSSSSGGSCITSPGVSSGRAVSWRETIRWPSQGLSRWPA